MFKTGQKMRFRYDDPLLNFIYMNGGITIESTEEELYTKFPSPFVQKRLFHYFSREIFDYTGQVRAAFEDVSAIFSPEGIHIKNLIACFEAYLKENRDWLLKDAPKRKDLRIYEAVFHFCLSRYLCDFLQSRQAQVYPEFPTGNGKIDLLIKYGEQVYGLELKSYSDETEYRKALRQAAQYGKEYGFPQVWLISFVEYVDDATRQKYEQEHIDPENGGKVMPLFVETGR